MTGVEMLDSDELVVTLERPIKDGSRHSLIRENQQVRLNTVKSNTFNYGRVIHKHKVDRIINGEKFSSL